MKVLCTMLALLACTGARAAEGAACDGWLIDAKLDIWLAKVVAPDPAHFVRSDGGCPTIAKRCMRPGYVVSGDVVVLGQRSGEWQCATFPNAQGGTDGWLPANALAEFPVDHSPPLAAWRGDWRRDRHADIKIGARGRDLEIDGLAFFDTGIPGGINDGELSGKIQVNGNVAQFKDDESDCTATLWLAGPYLIVQDNGSCGGLNVSFTGVYRRP